MRFFNYKKLIDSRLGSIKAPFIASHAILDILLGGFLHNLAAIIHIALAIVISMVIYMTLTCSSAGSNLRSGSLVVRSTLTLALFRNSTLGMCHRL